MFWILHEMSLHTLNCKLKFPALLPSEGRPIITLALIKPKNHYEKKKIEREKRKVFPPP